MSGYRLLPEWVDLFNAMPEGCQVSATEMFVTYHRAWPRSEGQLGHALRSIAREGLLAKPGRGQFVRREGSLAFADGTVHLRAGAAAKSEERP